ncbi:MAG: hypothetical protein ACRD0G_10585 [Acidimicrobiales bacterium]
MRSIGEVIGSQRRPLGRFQYETVEDPPAFIVRASGAVGPKLFKDSLARAEEFGAAHPEGWVYIADLRRELWPSPRNLRYLRRVRKLPNNRRYIAVAPLPFRVALRPLRLIGGPHKVVRSPKRALKAAAKHTNVG